jgi:osmotically-inducible protein OsmY
MAELEWEPSVHGTQVGVEVKDGVVILSGHVDSFPEKWEVERAALRVSGVKALAVDIQVRLAALHQRDDDEIAGAARNALQWMASHNNAEVKVMVEGGWLTLSGEVDWQYQKLAASDATRHLMGVVGISNQIAIKPKITPIQVQAEIEAALSRHAKADAKNIKVHVRGSDVTLSGSVESWAERQNATHAAWGMPGVRNVVDQLVLSF